MFTVLGGHFFSWRLKKNSKIMTLALHLHELSLCKWTFQLNSWQPFALYIPHKLQRCIRKVWVWQEAETGQTKESWACSTLPGTVLEQLHGAHWAVCFSCTYSLGGLQVNLLLLKAPTRKTVCGKEEAGQYANWCALQLLSLDKKLQTENKINKALQVTSFYCVILTEW